ncbi:hypothetical protein ACJMK2_039214 [Sinanodonta woodiana]|uniref:Uncharacterized protein n=1 Tax=Sinanodonta woodiana TaxID=1069815 RepID=A0ABD3WEN8_SINWO
MFRLSCSIHRKILNIETQPIRYMQKNKAEEENMMNHQVEDCWCLHTLKKRRMEKKRRQVYGTGQLFSNTLPQ